MGVAGQVIGIISLVPTIVLLLMSVIVYWVWRSNIPPAPAQMVRSNVGAVEDIRDKTVDSLISVSASKVSDNAIQIMDKIEAESDIDETDEPIEITDQFLLYWQKNLLDSMVNLCSPSWSQALDNSTNPKAELFSLLLNYTMLKYEFINIDSSINDKRCTVTYYANMYPPGKTTAVRYELRISVEKESGHWYVDPRSISTNAF